MVADMFAPNYYLDGDVMAWSWTNMKISSPVQIKLLPFYHFSQLVHVPVQIFSFESVHWDLAYQRKPQSCDQLEAFAMAWKEYGVSGVNGHRVLNRAESEWKREAENAWKEPAEGFLKCQRNAKRIIAQFPTQKLPSCSSCTK